MEFLSSLSVQVTEERRIKHYSNTHKILLVGDGDFSFFVCLANAFGSALNMVATSLDSRGMVLFASQLLFMLSVSKQLTINF